MASDMIEIRENVSNAITIFFCKLIHHLYFISFKINFVLRHFFSSLQLSSTRMKTWKWMHSLCIAYLFSCECSASAAPFAFVLPGFDIIRTPRGVTRVHTSTFRQGPTIRMQASPSKPMMKKKVEAEDATIPSSSGPKVSWPSLQAAQFRHPLDSQATIAVQRLFPFENVVRQSMGGMIEQMVYLDNMSNGIKVGNNQLPKIYKRFRIIVFLPAVFLCRTAAFPKERIYSVVNSLLEAKTILGLQDLSVDLFVRQNPVPNAYTMALQVHCTLTRRSLISLAATVADDGVVAVRCHRARGPSS
jgi:hypothetical protein